MLLRCYSPSMSLGDGLQAAGEESLSVTTGSRENADQIPDLMSGPLSIKSAPTRPHHANRGRKECEDSIPGDYPAPHEIRVDNFPLSLELISELELGQAGSPPRFSVPSARVGIALFLSGCRSGQTGRCAVDVTELRKALRERHAQAEERRDRRGRRLRTCLHVILIVLAMAVFMLVFHRVAQ